MGCISYANVPEALRGGGRAGGTGWCVVSGPAPLLRRLLAAAGVEAVYGPPLAALPAAVSVDPAVAPVLAVAHRRVHRAPALAHLGDGLLVAGPQEVTGTGPVPDRRRGAPPPAGGDAPTRPGAPVVGASGRPAPVDGDPVPVVDAHDPDAALAALSGLLAGDHARLRLDIDPNEVVPAGALPQRSAAERWLAPDEGVLGALHGATAPVVLAGPGVVAAGAVAGLHALAAAGSLGVLNTWGAKGVFDWRSRHHLATAGLQADDWLLGGLAGADLVVATGLDPAEAPEEGWRHLAPVVDVPPAALDPLAERWGRPHADIAVPPLRAGLAAVTQDGWASAAAPLAPSRATLHHARALVGGGLIAADAGVAGYWVARTFGTTELGTVHVPARPVPGFAAAAALVARLRWPDRPVLAVVDGPPDAPTLAVQAAGAGLGVAVPVEAWSPDGPALDAEAHERALAELVAATEPRVATLVTDPAQLARMVEVAGPVTAWGGIAGG